VFRVSVQLLSATFLILRRTERDIVKVYIGLHVKCRYCQVLMTLEAARQIFEIYSNSMKLHPAGAELFRADRRTDGRTDGHDEVNSRLS
jgi:queuine/archaeosine tRNA-ribosyltransferase